MRLQGKTVIVTGASSGMGRCICERFVKEGAAVIAAARREDRLKELRESLQDEAGRLIPCVGDITTDETADKLFQMAEECGGLDCLINNAGVMDDMSPVGEISMERYRKVFALNVEAPLRLMQRAVNCFRRQDSGGSIINIASEGAFHTCAGAIYAASKAALIALTQNTAFMYMPEGIRCNAIVPGGFATEIASSMGTPNTAGYERAAKVIACGPQPGDPREIANAALFLTSDEASFISGEKLFVDGGWGAM